MTKREKALADRVSELEETLMQMRDEIDTILGRREDDEEEDDEDFEEDEDEDLDDEFDEDDEDDEGYDDDEAYE